MNIRIIPRLDVKGPNLVKGIHLEGLRVLGKPERFARHYYEQGADELIYMDTVASLYGRNSLLDIISETARQIFIPLTVGGGIRSIDDIRDALRAGADKVSLNTAVIKTPNLIRDASRRFGSSTIVVSIEALRKADGTYEADTDPGREPTGVDGMAGAIHATELGAGELMVTSIDREGTGKGFDLSLIQTIADSVPVPVIACGGAGGVQDVRKVVQEGRADAVCLASVLHYNFLRHDQADDDFNAVGNIEHLKSGQGFSRVTDVSLRDMKVQLTEMGIECRLSGVHADRA